MHSQSRNRRCSDCRMESDNVEIALRKTVDQAVEQFQEKDIDKLFKGDHAKLRQVSTFWNRDPILQCIIQCKRDCSHIHENIYLPPKPDHIDTIPIGEMKLTPLLRYNITLIVQEELRAVDTIPIVRHQLHGIYDELVGPHSWTRNVKEIVLKLTSIGAPTVHASIYLLVQKLTEQHYLDGTQGIQEVALTLQVAEGKEPDHEDMLIDDSTDDEQMATEPVLSRIVLPHSSVCNQRAVSPTAPLNHESTSLHDQPHGGSKRIRSHCDGVQMVLPTSTDDPSSPPLPKRRKKTHSKSTKSCSGQQRECLDYTAMDDQGSLDCVGDAQNGGDCELQHIGLDAQGTDSDCIAHGQRVQDCQHQDCIMLTGTFPFKLDTSIYSHFFLY